MQTDIGQGTKPPGYYVHRSSGLFPAPRPQDDEDMCRVEELFKFIGRLFAKCIQDGRLVDVPLSKPFLKLMCMGDVYANKKDLLRGLSNEWDHLASYDDDRTPTEENAKELPEESISSPLDSYQKSKISFARTENLWYADILTDDDFNIIDPHRGQFLAELRTLLTQWQALQSRTDLDEEERLALQSKLSVGDRGVKLEDLG